jgi:hypothetical protein
MGKGSRKETAATPVLAAPPKAPAPTSPAPKPKAFDPDLTADDWKRLQARLRFRVAWGLAVLAALLFVAAGVTWACHLGYPPESTTTTTVTKAGVEESRTEIKESPSPLVGLPVALALFGLLALTPMVTWAIAPGSKIGVGPDGLNAEGTPEPPELKSARPKVKRAVERTPQGVDRMIEVTSNAVEQPPQSPTKDSRVPRPRR